MGHMTGLWKLLQLTAPWEAACPPLLCCESPEAARSACISSVSVGCFFMLPIKSAKQRIIAVGRSDRVQQVRVQR